MTDEELTRLAAERVLGYTLVPASKAAPSGLTHRTDTWWLDGALEAHCYAFLPLYRWLDSGALVEALHKQGWHVVLVWSTEGYARARFERMESGQLVVREAQEADPLRAIVIAALRAVGVEA